MIKILQLPSFVRSIGSSFIFKTLVNIQVVSSNRHDSFSIIYSYRRIGFYIFSVAFPFYCLNSNCILYLTKTKDWTQILANHNGFYHEYKSLYFFFFCAYHMVPYDMHHVLEDTNNYTNAYLICGKTIIGSEEANQGRQWVAYTYYKGGARVWGTTVYVRLTWMYTYMCL